MKKLLYTNVAVWLLTIVLAAGMAWTIQQSVMTQPDMEKALAARGRVETTTARGANWWMIWWITHKWV